jgi:hypothetical protein
MTHMKLLLTFTVAAMLAAPAGASAGTPRALTPHEVAPATVWLGTPDATTAAYRTPASGSAILRADAGRVTTVPAPDGCSARAAGSGRIAYVCGPAVQTERAVAGTTLGGVTRPLAVTSTTGGDVVRLDQWLHADAAGIYAEEPSAVGERWIRSRNGGYHDHDGYADLNWRTGEQREWDLTDPRRVSDLDAPELTAPLCAPLRAEVLPPADISPGGVVRQQPVTVRGRWVLITHATEPVTATLHRCGTAAPVKLPSGFDLPVLGDGWLAQSHRNGIRLLRLSDNRQFRVPRVTSAQASDLQLSLTKGRLYVGMPVATGGNRRLLTVRLPRR